MTTQIGILQFPGSNCDVDCADTLSRHFHIKPVFIWHTEKQLPPLSGIVVPGGFSYGDYLRSGALAARAVCMDAVREFAKRGGPILGICNGFQILTEAGLLPGILLPNATRQFHCKHVYLRQEATSRTTLAASMGTKAIRIPIAHGDGRYYCSSEELEKLYDLGQVALKYASLNGDITEDANPNGSIDNIAGVTDPTGKILGLMPHPERATDIEMGGSTDGLLLWRAFLDVAGG